MTASIIDVIPAFLSSILDWLAILLWERPGDTWLLLLVVYATRLAVLGLTVRTYVAPWILAYGSKHIRVRSISLRSIRGIYVRRGALSLHVDRVRFAFEGISALHIKVDNVRLELGEVPVTSTAMNTERASWSPLSYLSPVISHLWAIAISLAHLVDPFVRPIFRSFVVASLRLLIHFLPRITQAVDLSIYSVTLSVKPLAGATISIAEVNVRTSVELVEVENAPPVEEVSNQSDPPNIDSPSTMNAWRRRMARSFSKALDRAWSGTIVASSLELQCRCISGHSINAELFQLPGSMNAHASCRFNPRKGIIDDRTVNVELSVGEFTVALNGILSVMHILKMKQPDMENRHEDVSVSRAPTKPPSQSPIARRLPGRSSFSGFGNRFTRNSQLFEAFSRSARREDSLKRKDKPQATSPWVFLLSRLHIKFADIKLTFAPSDKVSSHELFVASIQDVSLVMSPREAKENALHTSLIGKHKEGDDIRHCAYVISFHSRDIIFDRMEEMSEPFRLLNVGAIQLQLLLSDWPEPWLCPTPSLPGDPNTALMAIELDIAGIDVTERMDRLQYILSRTKSSAPPTSPGSRVLRAVPRIVFQASCGTICCNLICMRHLPHDKPLKLELRSLGFVVSATTEFPHIPFHDSHHILPHHQLPVRLFASANMALKPIFVRARSNWLSTSNETFGSATFPALDPDFMNDPPLLASETIEISLEGTVSGIVDDLNNHTSLDMRSAFWDLHCSSDVVCIELWHSDVITALKNACCSFLNPSSEPQSRRSSILTKMLPGISVTVGVARLVVFVTSSDIDPQNHLDITRGVAIRTSAAIQYSSVQPIHAALFPQLSSRSQIRHKLYLPEERSVEALSAARSSSAIQRDSAFIRVAFSGLKVRSAVATRFEQDEPRIAEEDDEVFQTQDFILVQNLSAELAIRGHRGAGQAEQDSCDIHLDVSSVITTFKLAHIYSTLLAIHSIRTFMPVRSPTDRKHSNNAPFYRIRATVRTLQIFASLQRQRVLCRVDAIKALCSSQGTNNFGWSSLICWASVPSVNRWQLEKQEGWEEVLRFQGCDVTLPRLPDKALRVRGNTARVRIPFGFVLADLVQDISVAVKALRHLRTIVDEEHYRDMETPGPEEAKIVPSVILQVKRIILEAEDDCFESKLSAIWRIGSEATKQRQDREDAFFAKVAMVEAHEPEQVPPHLAGAGPDGYYRFTSQHSVSIEEARERLDRLHVVDWRARYGHLLKSRIETERAVVGSLNSDIFSRTSHHTPTLFRVNPISLQPPLFRATLDDFVLKLSPPSFHTDHLPEFMFNLGKDIPRDTLFSLLVPLHLHFQLSSISVKIRDYPLPLISIPSTADVPGLTFDSDVVIGEEMGTHLSVDWIQCNILGSNHGIGGSQEWSLLVPKTIMPVKTYAHPVINVSTSHVTSFCWGGSYTPAIQDIMRVIDTLTTPPRDSSPTVGFWDKMRLVFHWTIMVNFRSDVRLYLKGSRDPFCIDGDGAGFVLCCQGHPQFAVGYPNEDKELLQLTGDSMLIAIPNLRSILDRGPTPYATGDSGDFQKICAKLQSGVRLGFGFTFERTCGDECFTCTGLPFHRQCRMFDFIPHYDVKLELKDCAPSARSSEDSYRTFRSDFVHFSFSMASSVGDKGDNHFSSIHLSPKTFTHFWSWWTLFDSELSLPIRQGSYYPFSKLASPKLGRHLATIKYRFNLPQIFLFHAYIEDSRDTWLEGVTPFVGAKARIGTFIADLHQREQETTVTTSNATKTYHKKDFYTAEVLLKDLEIRAVLASFSDPLKKIVPITASDFSGDYRRHLDQYLVDPSSSWIDYDDFVETDWSSTDPPRIALLPVAFCPHFTYFKQNSSRSDNHSQRTKFGQEDTHACLLGKAPPISDTQISLARDRLEELNRELAACDSISDSGDGIVKSLKKKIELLHHYIAHLRHTARSSLSEGHDQLYSYYMPSDASFPDDWTEFDNVYQIHHIRVCMDTAVRDIMMQYYHCSRARRGFEYHLATRAIKFIRDQVEATTPAGPQERTSKDKARGPAAGAQAAAQILRKILNPGESKTSTELRHDPAPSIAIDPLTGWSESDVFLSKSHFCLLLKPQIVLRSEESICIVAAVTARLQSFAIMDRANADDPVSGKIMSRIFTSVGGFQTFSPSTLDYAGDGYVPLEVLVDLRCESSDFDRIVPQTDAALRYDKFNRLRLRNSVTSMAGPSSSNSEMFHNDHLQNQTDLVRIHIPRFTAIASDKDFQALSRIVSDLLLFSDAAHKIRLEKLKTMLFMYDFADFQLCAHVVGDLQSRLRDAIETARLVQFGHFPHTEEGQLEFLKLKAHIFLLGEELTLLFDAIKLSQDRNDDRTDQKSALLLHASSSEISWRMLDSHKGTLAKLTVRDINYYWLNKQDSSMVNNLAVGDLQAFDGSPNAIWPEILCKHREPANHPLVRKKLFILSHWVVLAPVGGITIYQEFEVNLHPMRLQIDSRLGVKILEYLWPARKQRKLITDQAVVFDEPEQEQGAAPLMQKSSPNLLHRNTELSTALLPLPVPGLRRLTTSRSFTDLRSSATESLQIPKMKRTRSISSLRDKEPPSDRQLTKTSPALGRRAGDAAEMKTRSSQKSFVHVRIASMHLLLSIMKEESFACRDARICTRDLEYRNQTWSFEELVNQFIPSDTSWRGWVKMAFQQPLIPVLPVAKELWSKTSLVQKKKGSSKHDMPLFNSPRIRSPPMQNQDDRPPTTSRRRRAKSQMRDLDSAEDEERNGRRRDRFNFFSRASSRTRKSIDAPNSRTSTNSTKLVTARHSFDQPNH